MRETIYNIFYFVEEGTIRHAAIRPHDVDGSDEQKAERLKSAIQSDLAQITRVLLPTPITHATFTAMQRLGRHLEVFETLLEAVGVPSNPFCCITAIVDGYPRVDISTDHAPLPAQAFQSDICTLNEVQDWLPKYATEDGFDLPRLLHDDYFCAIKLLFNSEQYVSCMKLLLSFIDTVAFLAYGDEPSVFLRWLGTHTQISRLGITSQELWEMRNALLHMSNLDSRKVLKNRVRRISFCVASRGRCAPPDSETTYFNLLDLIDEIANGVSHWIAHINSNRDDLVYFVERYDRIISDDRLTYIPMPEQGSVGDSDKATAGGGSAGEPEG